MKANKGVPGVDGLTIEAALPWLKEHNHELTERIRRGKYTPSPVRRHERMAELLWNSGHEEQHRKPERMAVPPDTRTVCPVL